MSDNSAVKTEIASKVHRDLSMALVDLRGTLETRPPADVHKQVAMDTMIQLGFLDGEVLDRLFLAYQNEQARTQQ